MNQYYLKILLLEIAIEGLIIAIFTIIALPYWFNNMIML